MNNSDPEVCLLYNKDEDKYGAYAGVVLKRGCQRHYHDLPLAGFMMFGVVRITGVMNQTPDNNKDTKDENKNEIQLARDKRTELFREYYSSYIDTVSEMNEDKDNTKHY